MRSASRWNPLPWLLWPLLYLYPPFRGTIRARLGHFELGAYDPAAPGLKVLVNAVSAGEVVAISSFIRELKRQRPDSQVVLLTTTDSGQEMARQKLADALALACYFPLADLPFVVRRYLDRLRPDLYISCESELWPNIQSQCRRRGIPLPAYADAIAPGIALAQAIGRWGNWFNQELYGKPTDLPWAILRKPFQVDQLAEVASALLAGRQGTPKRRPRKRGATAAAGS